MRVRQVGDDPELPVDQIAKINGTAEIDIHGGLRGCINEPPGWLLSKVVIEVFGVGWLPSVWERPRRFAALVFAPADSQTGVVRFYINKTGSYRHDLALAPAEIFNWYVVSARGHRLQ